MIDTDDEEYFDDYEKRLRDVARYWAAEADKNVRCYRNALSSGCDEETVNAFYDLIKCCQANMKEANDDAADIIFEINNDTLPAHIIDLHRLFVSEAIIKLTDRVNYAVNRRMLQLIVIVGRGTHSDGGPKLNTAVANFASEHDIRYSSDPLNPGRITLYLENVSQIPSQESESEVSRSSMRMNEVTLSEFITQTEQKNSTLSPLNVKGSKNRKQKKRKKIVRKVKDCSVEVPSSATTTQIEQRKEPTHSQNAIGSVDLEPNSHSHIQRKGSTHIRPNGEQSSQNLRKRKKRKKTVGNVNDGTNEVPSSGTWHNANGFKYRVSALFSSICRFVFVLIGVMLLAISFLI